MISLTIGLLLYSAAASVAVIGVTADQLYRAHSRKLLRMKREADRRRRFLPCALTETPPHETRSRTNPTLLIPATARHFHSIRRSQPTARSRNHKSGFRRHCCVMSSMQRSVSLKHSTTTRTSRTPNCRRPKISATCSTVSGSTASPPRASSTPANLSHSSHNPNNTPK